MVELNNLEDITKLENNLENNQRGKEWLLKLLFFCVFWRDKKNFFKKIFLKIFKSRLTST